MRGLLIKGLIWLLASCTYACSEQAWNNPYPVAQKNASILYSSFSERPKHLDPARSYSSNEYALIAQIYEPPLQYHYLRRPYEIIPATAQALPQVRYLNQHGEQLADDAPSEQVAFSVYELRLKADVRYQPHPAFAQDAQGGYLYHELTAAQLSDINVLGDFAQTGSRTLHADDYVYQIKRLAHPRIHSPIFGVMAEYIVGLPELAEQLRVAYEKIPEAQRDAAFLDLRDFPLEGAQALDATTYTIKIRGKYPQLIYWLTMPFFAPMPVEADQFYAQSGLVEKNIKLDWYPVGTGPYMLTENNPNRRMVLQRNPNFHAEFYPEDGAPGDAALGLLDDAGKLIPFVDQQILVLEKEEIPRWNKFLQGYYDVSGISSDSFDQAIQFGAGGDVLLTEEMRSKGIQLQTAVATTSYYMGVNMLDPVVGGLSEKNRLLRRAISIAVDYEEFISIFLNGRGITAQGPLPPGIAGHVAGQAGVNPYVYDWVDGRAKRKSIEQARALLAQAGYPNGIDPQTQKPLQLHYDVVATGPDDKAQLAWWRKQFKKLNLELVIRDSDYNRFQDKVRNGKAQFFTWGWNADYPDPENFLFLLYGENAVYKNNGQNSANYENPAFDRLFRAMKNMENSPQRQEIVNKMVDIARQDAPWLWGFHPKQFVLHHDWYFNAKPNLIANNTLKFKRIDVDLRAQKRAQWNQPITAPVVIALVLFIALVAPAFVAYLRKARLAPNKAVK